MNKLIYISAEWCGPCKQLTPVIQQVAAAGIPVQKLDADKDQQFIQKYAVRSVPTIIKVDASGREIAKRVGAGSKQDIIEFYNKN